MKTKLLILLLTCAFLGAVGLCFAADPAVVKIASPAYGSTHIAGDPIQFNATITANGRNVDEASLVWISNLDGRLGTGLNLMTNALSIGSHRITFSASDANGALGSDTIKVNVSRSKASDADAPVYSKPSSHKGEDYVVNPFE